MKRLTFSFLLFLISIITFGQTNYYVSPTGNNANTGTLSMPWLTIQYGLNQINANDTLNVLTGTFTEKISMPASNIYLRNYLSNAPIIDAAGINDQNAIIAISNKSNITISGFELKNNIQNDAQGILIDGSGADITVKNCKIHDIHFSSIVSATVNEGTNAQGIIVYGSNATTAITNLKIQNNQLYDCRLGYSEGIAVNGNVNGFEVSGNTVYNLTNIGIDLIGHEGTCSNPANDQARNGLVKNNIAHHCLSAYASSGGIYIDGGKLITVENNTSYHNGYGIEVGCENIGKTTYAIIIRNNIFYDNEVCAVALGGYDYPSGSGKVINSSFRNNTCYYNDFSSSGNGELYLSYSENSTIENNIFFVSNQKNLAYAELSQPSLNFNYNTIYCVSGPSALMTNWNGSSYTGYSSFVTGSSTNINSVFNNPLFVSANSTTPNFHLTFASPSINSGNSSYTPSVSEIDMDGELRANGTVDCGADEYYTTIGITENTSTNQYSLYPNPFSTETTVHTEIILKNATLTVYNSYGQKVKQMKNIWGQTITLYRDNLSSGVYFIQLKQNSKVIFAHKLVITY